MKSSAIEADRVDSPVPFAIETYRAGREHRARTGAVDGE